MPYIKATKIDVIKAINAARKSRTSSKLSSLDLSDVDLSGLDLSNVEFSRCKLHNTNLSNTYLKNAVICYSDLKNVNFSGSYLYNADFICNQTFTDINFSYADLSSATLCGSRYHIDNHSNPPPQTPARVIFKDAIIRGVAFKDITFTNELYEINSHFPELLKQNLELRNIQHDIFPYVIKNNKAEPPIVARYSPDYKIALSSNSNPYRYSHAYLILDLTRLASSSNLRKAHKNPTQFLKNCEILNSHGVFKSAFIKTVLDDPSITQIIQSHPEQFKALLDSGLASQSTIQRLAKDPQQSTLIKMLIEQGLDAAIESCQTRNNPDKLKIAKFFKQQLESATTVAELKVILKCATAGLSYRSNFFDLFAAKAYKAAQPHFIHAKTLLGIDNTEWKNLLSESYWNRNKPSLQQQKDHYYRETAAITPPAPLPNTLTPVSPATATPAPVIPTPVAPTLRIPAYAASQGVQSTG
ncbi:pentapeptide repeat-containing protein [Piscirickettsia salmonis]|uniref:pentapeptide repeat-containing protein n=1 Tax=Piscirickettsia salmonis TaxID=1238 RepID=UPI0007C8D815|nr:Pentapeptide repeats (8 copies) [Piscirickettsiaceae bacterium NZ-RLO1]